MEVRSELGVPLFGGVSAVAADFWSQVGTYGPASEGVTGSDGGWGIFRRVGPDILARL